MVDNYSEIRWDTIALIQFKEIFVYIRKDSYQNALKVKKKIYIDFLLAQSNTEQRCPKLDTFVG